MPSYLVQPFGSALFVWRYYVAIFPFVLPWMLAIVLIGLYIHAKKAESLLGLSADDSKALARRATLFSALICLPVALFTPIWCGTPMIVYWVLALVVQFNVVQKMHPELDDKLIWTWSYAANGIAGGLACIVYVCTAVCFIAYQSQVKHYSVPRAGAHISLPVGKPVIIGNRMYFNGSSFRFPHRRASEDLEGVKPAPEINASSLRKAWFPIPDAVAGKWAVVQKTSEMGYEKYKYKTTPDPNPEMISFGTLTDGGKVWQTSRVSGCDLTDLDPAKSYEAIQVILPASSNEFRYVTYYVVSKSPVDKGASIGHVEKVDTVKAPLLNGVFTIALVDSTVYDGLGKPKSVEKYRMMFRREAAFSSDPTGRDADGKTYTQAFKEFTENR